MDVHEHVGGIGLLILIGDVLILLYLSVIYLALPKFIVRLLITCHFEVLPRLQKKKQLEWAAANLASPQIPLRRRQKVTPQPLVHLLYAHMQQHFGTPWEKPGSFLLQRIYMMLSRSGYFACWTRSPKHRSCPRWWLCGGFGTREMKSLIKNPSSDRSVSPVLVQLHQFSTRH